MAAHVFMYIRVCCSQAQTCVRRVEQGGYGVYQEQYIQAYLLLATWEHPEGQSITSSMAWTWCYAKNHVNGSIINYKLKYHSACVIKLMMDTNLDIAHYDVLRSTANETMRATAFMGATRTSCHHTMAIRKPCTSHQQMWPAHMLQLVKKTNDLSRTWTHNSSHT